MNQKNCSKSQNVKGLLPLKQNGHLNSPLSQPSSPLKGILGPIFLSFVGAFRGAILQVIFLGSSCVGFYLHPMEDSITT